MSLQALIELSKIKELSEAGMIRLQEARKRQAEYDKKIELQVENKSVSQELLRKTCSI